jgi:peptidoglycan/LPS O-acetylase OafA/YrhL
LFRWATCGSLELNLGIDDPMKIQSLTIFRWPLAIWVILHHLLDSTFLVHNNYFFLRTLAEIGNTAVIGFFVLSGFVISFSWNKYSGKKWGLRTFYLHRLASLYPMFMVSNLVLFFISEADKDALIPNLFFIQPFSPSGWMALNGPGWSLGAEFFFYLLFPFLVVPVSKLTKARQAKISIIVLVIIDVCLNVAGNLLLQPESMIYFNYHFPPYQLIHFVEGMIVFRLYCLTKENIKRNHFSQIFAFFVFFISIIFSITLPFESVKYGFLISASTCYLIYVLAKFSKNTNSSLRLFLVKLGNSSFMLYITHWIWLGNLRSFLVNITNIFVFIGLFFCFLIAISIFFDFFQHRVVDRLTSQLMNHDWKIFKTLIVILVFSINCYFLGKFNPVYWNKNNIPKNPSINVQVVKGFLEGDKFILQLVATNSNSFPIKLDRCYIILVPTDVKQDSKRPKPIPFEAKNIVVPTRNTMNGLLNQIEFKTSFSWYADFPENFTIEIYCK